MTLKRYFFPSVFFAASKHFLSPGGWLLESFFVHVTLIFVNSNLFLALDDLMDIFIV